ncbi:unnamed protein product [Strongylus vulgaris]|uniref:Uncharacterized protein n=1 Tax=Strongylus vulgaris TaxID=40348 RepID=A0A3P7IYA3_STRVU|nr:unnamed protein product [Strongylus vulgaris]
MFLRSNFNLQNLRQVKQDRSGHSQRDTQVAYGTNTKNANSIEKPVMLIISFTYE